MSSIHTLATEHEAEALRSATALEAAAVELRAADASLKQHTVDSVAGLKAALEAAAEASHSEILAAMVSRKVSHGLQLQSLWRTPTAAVT